MRADYTEAILRCLRKLSGRRLEELQKRLESEFACTEVLPYLRRLIYRAKEDDT